MKNAKDRITVLLPPKLAEHLRKSATDNRRTLSAQVEELIARDMASQEQAAA